MNFRTFYTYNVDGTLKSERYYSFDDNNVQCKIIDSSDYTELFYFYESNESKPKLVRTEKYFPKLDSNGKIVGRELYYIYDHKKDKYSYHSTNKR